MTESKWITFEEVAKVPSRKTKFFEVRTKDQKVVLGYIAWFSSWRKYCFYPSADTIFETQCLTDIVAFIRYLMEERKKLKNAIS